MNNQWLSIQEGDLIEYKSLHSFKRYGIYMGLKSIRLGADHDTIEYSARIIMAPNGKLTTLTYDASDYTNVSVRSSISLAED
jgi:hypothetical protein